MFLKSLTIKGFKSFARKTVLEFEPGVTIIVGPNGSGKSNIADAVMWVLGEQSPTSLRGNRMEDVIFAGSTSLKPVNIAEVSLTLDNSNNDFPLEYSEVIITRNVVRGGDSEYRLNNSSCRLLDIQELLSDAGVGRTLNSVISQGQLDDVLTCRPEERRDYIEEAGGLLKFRKRREKAVRRLSRMDDELTRTNDVAREVRRLLRPLQRQAGRLEQYTGLVRELNDARLRLDVARLRAMRREWEEHLARQEDRQKRLDAMDVLLKELAAEAAKLEAEQSGWRAREESSRNGLYRIVSLHEMTNAMLTLWDEKARRSKEQSAGGPAVDPAELDKLASENAGLVAEREELLGKQEELRGKDVDVSKRLSELNGKLNDAARERAALEGRLDVLRRSLSEDGPAKRLIEKRAQLDRLESGRQEGTSALSAAEREADGTRERAEEIESKIESLVEERDSAGQASREAERAVARLSATLDILTRLDTETWGPANTSAALMKDDPTGGRLGAMLARSMKIDPRYETAVNSYIGPWLFGLVASDSAAIMKAIEHLKENGLGQGLFFRQAAGQERKTAARQIEGAVFARDTVQAPAEFSGALDVLLEDVYLARDLEAAVALAQAYPALVFLSPDGDVMTGGTMVKGGSVTISPLAVEQSAGRRRKLEDDLASARKKLDELESKRNNLGAAVEKARADLAGARERAGAARDSFDETRARNATEEAMIESLKKDLDALAAEAGEPQGPTIAELEAGLAGLARSAAGTAAEIAMSEAESRTLAEDLRAATARLGTIDRRLEIGRIKERDMRARRPDRPDRAAPAIEDDDLAMLVSLHERLAGQLQAARKKARIELEEGSIAQKKAAEGLHELREDVSEKQREHEQLRDLVHSEELARAELKVRVEQLVERVVDDHKMPLDFALKQYPDEELTPELEARAAELAQELEQIGPVNPEAIVERETLEQRYEFLKAQIDDIEQARGQLKRVLRQIDKEIEQKFVQTLELVNGHFMEIFSSLFPNGRAELSLTDPEDILASGVEILAQPEGKRLRRISLLSGGETSMTALAFFFALFRVRPSPFYFLDEVEAALDDVNLHRFLNMVKEFKSESQLVLITHQKRSMEIADLLYGISMQDDGMSRVVSQRLNEPDEKAS